MHVHNIEHACLVVLQSTSEHGTCPKIVFIGTHKDLEHECQHENREEKDRKLLSIIPPDMKNHVISCDCLLYTSPSPRDATLSRMPSSA